MIIILEKRDNNLHNYMSTINKSLLYNAEIIVVCDKHKMDNLHIIKNRFTDVEATEIIKRFHSTIKAIERKEKLETIIDG